MEALQEVGLLLLVGFGLLAACVFLLLGSAVLVGGLGVVAKYITLWRRRIEQQLEALDANPVMVEFGQGYEGRWLNQRLQNLQASVDEPTDPIYQAAFKLPLIKQAWQAGILSPEQASQAFGDAVGLAVKITDGIPNLTFEVVPDPSALPRG